MIGVSRYPGRGSPPGAVAAAVGRAARSVPPGSCRWSTWPSGRSARTYRPWTSFLRPRTITVAVSTVSLAVLVGIGTIAIGVPLAWLTARTDLPARRLWSILTAVPLAIPSYVLGLGFIAAFGSRGALQDVLAPFGVERLPSIGGLFGATLVLVLASYPYVLLSTRAALLRTDPSTEEAARMLGDGRLAVFWRVSLPLLLPAIAAGALLAVLYALADFGAVSLLRFDSFSQAIYTQYRASFDRSLAAVLALVLVGLTLALTWGEARLRRRAGSHKWRTPLPAAADDRPARSLALARGGVLRSRGRARPRHPGRNHQLVACPRHGSG